MTAQVAQEDIAGSWRVLLWNGGSLWIGRGGAGVPHAHHAIQISVALTGQVRLRSRADTDWPTLSGAVVLPHQQHQFDSGGASAANIFVEPETLVGRSLLKRFSGLPINPLARETIEPLAATLRTAYENGAGNPSLIAASRQLVADLSGEEHPALRVDARITRAIDHIRSHLRESLALADIAEVAHLSPSRFRHLFVAQTGTSLRAYLLWARIEAAVGLAMDGANWTEAAHNCGFADSAHLSRTCKRMFGIAPSMLVRR